MCGHISNKTKAMQLPPSFSNWLSIFQQWRDKVKNRWLNWLDNFRSKILAVGEKVGSLPYRSQIIFHGKLEKGLASLRTKKMRIIIVASFLLIATPLLLLVFKVNIQAVYAWPGQISQVVKLKVLKEGAGDFESPAPTADLTLINQEASQEERISQLENGLVKAGKDQLTTQTSFGQLQNDLKGAVAEVAKNNDILTKQRNDLLTELNNMEARCQKTVTDNIQAELDTLKTGQGTVASGASSTSDTASSDNTSSVGGSESSAAPTTSDSQTQKVNLNTATASELDTLPGIGPAYAQKIIQYRSEKSRFNKIEDIMNVTGIGQATFAKLKDLVEV